MKVRDLTNIALFTAIMGVLGLFPPIPLSFTPVPLTLQTVGIFLTAGLLGARKGFYSQAVFLLLVAVGVPLLSGGRGGLGVFVGPSAGYIFGYAIITFCLGFALSQIKELTFMKLYITNIIIGVFLLYCIGVPVQAFVMDLSIIDVIKISLVYIPGDIIKATIATYIVYQLRKRSVIQKQLQKAS
ncbi:biotin transporter BioY [Bacillus massiliigorillae]|uniref:biotin transporter BioY n=1 Tax=Bacillus massiliigorillae TaxID=1243664 RepID=UPI0003A853A7|nr:biotin transporter BioY [Bacillus massiliigorillae]